ncbi:transcriptional regulator, partial [Pseudomonas aeruginosa]|nr:transcriptional regulator [Pseudomonas aeruginosa]
PDTGEVVETKGGNHKVLKAWKEQYGAQTVDGWLQ